MTRVYRSYVGLQRGNGLGSIFSGLLKVLVPIVKHPITKKIGQKVGKIAVGTLQDYQQGIPLKSSIKQRVGQEVANYAIKRMGSTKRVSVSKKRKRKPIDIFDKK